MTCTYPPMGKARLCTKEDFERALRLPRKQTVPTSWECVISEELALHWGLVIQRMPPSLHECCKAFAHLRLKRGGGTINR